jgi:hypothetical protein
MTFMRLDRRALAIGTAVLTLALGAPLAAFATASNVSFTSDTPLVVPGSGIDLTVLSGSHADSVVLDTNTVTVTVSGTDTLHLQAPANNKLVNNKSLNPCAMTGGIVTVTVTAASSPVVFTPSATICVASSGGGGSNVTTVTPAITVATPNGGERLEPGVNESISWNTAGRVDQVNVAYSANGGSAWTTLASDIVNTGNFSWTVPDIATTDALVRVQGTDGVTIFASDVSNAPFTILGTQPAGGQPSSAPECTSDAACGITRDAQGRRIAPPSGRTGPSPITELTEDISQVHPGQFIRSFGFDTVYLVTADGKRRAFWNTSTYFSWSNSFDDIVWVTDATLATLPLGTPVLPKPGVVLVKIESDPKTYAVDAGADGVPVLRWVPTEALAIARYGAGWADYVIDVEPTLFTHYRVGAAESDATAQDLSQMKTRAQIAALAVGP